jgi:uncharacterized protein YdaU (DUF1376 family)
MTNEQRGMYILLLCIQHQKGHLTENDMKIICNSNDEVVLSKFVKEGDKYYNLRMKEESEKRRKYCESRADNKKGKTKDMKNICKSYDNHMEDENVIINKDINVKNKNTKTIIPTLQEFLQIGKEK